MPARGVGPLEVDPEEASHLLGSAPLSHQASLQNGHGQHHRGNGHQGAGEEDGSSGKLAFDGVQGHHNGAHDSSGGGSGGGGGSARRRGGLYRSYRHCVDHEPLLLLTLAGVVGGVVGGLSLSYAHLGPTALEFLGLPGDIMMRLLKMLVLPLMSASVIAGVCALQQSTMNMGKVARYTLLYYLSTTIGAVALGIAVVNIVRPGRGAPFDQLESVGSCHAASAAAIQTARNATASPHDPTESLLAVVRSAFPDNLVVAAFNMNIIGVITASLLFGAALSSMGTAAAPMVKLVGVFNEAIAKIVGWVIWLSPLGIASLIASSICKTCSLGATLAALGLFIATVMTGLLIWSLLVLPALFYATTGRSPMVVFKGFSQAMATAFGTDSSNATLPITMACAMRLGCNEDVVQFFLPLGTTVNMNGTALYEAVTVIFIAQAHGEDLGVAGTVIVAATATLAAVGAAGIPSAGLVTMLMVLQAVGLQQYSSDIAIILAVDWFLDRCRTVCNVLGDAFGTVIIDHHARRWMAAPSTDASPTATTPGTASDSPEQGKLQLPR